MLLAFYKNIEEYRYGFQGQESDNEIKGNGNSVNYKYRMHDPRLGRFFAVDPLADKYPHNSPYAFSENMVIHAIELEGLEAYVVVFPDYKISTPLGKIGGLGHGGSMIIDPGSGDTYYVEYGRYESSKGNARVIHGHHKIGQVSFGEDGKPTEESLSNVFKTVSKYAGHGGRIEAAEFDVTKEEFVKMLFNQGDYLDEANDRDRKPYKLQGKGAHNCGTVACGVVSDNKLNSEIPEKVSARPVKMIQQVLDNSDKATRVGYNADTGETTRGGEYISSPDEQKTDLLLKKKGR